MTIEDIRQVILNILADIAPDEDISSIVGVPLGPVNSRINSARLQLQADLKDLR